MLSRAQGGLQSYNVMRGDLATMIAEIGQTATTVAEDTPRRWSIIVEQTGRAIQEIAEASSDVAVS